MSRCHHRRGHQPVPGVVLFHDSVAGARPLRAAGPQSLPGCATAYDLRADTRR
jgi:hypothetical protein